MYIVETMCPVCGLNETDVVPDKLESLRWVDAKCSHCNSMVYLVSMFYADSLPEDIDANDPLL